MRIKYKKGVIYMGMFLFGVWTTFLIVTVIVGFTTVNLVAISIFGILLLITIFILGGYCGEKGLIK